MLTPALTDSPVDLPSSSRELLDDTSQMLSSGDVSVADEFAARLDHIRRATSAADWQAFIDHRVASHPVRALFHEDPFTWRAFAKPRGYAGDAELLDLIYADAPPNGPVSRLGTQLYDWSVEGTSCRSVRARRDILAALIDRIASERPAPRILSVACGHLREAQRSAAVRDGAISELIALDQDPLSLELVEREQTRFNVKPVRGSVRRLLVNATSLGTFDLIYSAGLYDYLPAPTARALTHALFSALRPGGTLLVANFAPSLPDIGYMEAIMDWRLIYRDEGEVEEFADDIPTDEIASKDMFRDEPGNVVYLTLRRRERGCT